MVRPIRKIAFAVILATTAVACGALPGLAPALDAQAQPLSPTSIRLLSSASTVQTGQAVTYTAIVSPTPDAGSVAFTDDGEPIPACTAVSVEGRSGEAGCQTSYQAGGMHAIQATYTGDGQFQAAGPASAEVLVTVNTEITISVEPERAQVGQRVTYTALVSPAPDGGTVLFSDEDEPIASCETVAVDPASGLASCSLVYESPGEHLISALYTGDTIYLSSFAELSGEALAIEAAPRASATPATSSSGGAHTGKPKSVTSGTAKRAARRPSRRPAALRCRGGSLPASGLPTGTARARDRARRSAARRRTRRTSLCPRSPRARGRRAKSAAAA